MKTLIMIIILIILYIITTYLAYKYVQLSHSEGGRWERLKIDGDDLFMVFFPLFNIPDAFGYICGTYQKDNNKLNDLFKVKKEK